MSGGMPELGSKISLISKADIRYEGRLYTVDPQECTIALSSVRSFGTEDRETQFQIAPQSQIYDYILFRGSDIKDIRVVNNSLPHPNDPAIMQVQLPNGQHIMPHFPMPSMNPHPPPPPMGTGAYGNPFGAMGGLGMNATGSSAAASLAPGAGVGGASLAPGAFMLNNQQQHQHQQQQQQNKQQQKQPNLLAGASRSTTPISLISRKSPSADLGIQVNHQQQQPQHHQNSNNQHHQNNAGHGGGGGGGNVRDAGHKRQNHHQQRGGGNNNNNQRNNNANTNNDYYNQRDRRDSSGRNMDNYNSHHQDSRGVVGGGAGGNNNFNNQRNQQGQNRAWTMHRGQNNASGGGGGNNVIRNRGGGGGGRGRMSNQGYRAIAGGTGGNQNKPRNAKNTIKFEQDYDFEQANNQFEELRSQLTKLKVGDEPKITEQINGEAADKKDDSGNETGAGEHEPEDEEITVGYDKTKSFFDNISCEAAQDRSKNKKNDWRHERKLNSETFGVSSTRRGGRHFFANSYRGRGNYYNRNTGTYNSGFNRNYRGGNNYNRNRNHRTGGGNNMNQNNLAHTINGGAGGPGGNVTGSNDPSTLKNQQPNVSAAATAGSNSEVGGAIVATTSTASSIKTSTASTMQENNAHSQLAAPIAAGQ